MIASIVALQLAYLTQGACVNGTKVSCTITGCKTAYKVCDGGILSPCECWVWNTVCTAGAVQACTLSGCLGATQTCNASGQWDPCTCACYADTNPCTDDLWSNGQCTHPPRTGASCNDNNACTVNDTCNSAAQCVGVLALVDDGNPCTWEAACDPSTGTIHVAATTDASNPACSVGNYFCFDKYGRVTRKLVCVKGQPCVASCP